MSEFLFDTLKDLIITRAQYIKYQSEKKSPLLVENKQNTTDEDQQFHEKSILEFGKSLFDNKEYFRCWNILKECTSQLGFFLASYSLFLAGESIRQNNSQQNAQSNSLNDQKSKFVNPHLNQLRSRFEQYSKKLDAFNLYLYGVVLRELNLPQYLKKLTKSIFLFPYLWAGNFLFYFLFLFLFLFLFIFIYIYFYLYLFLFIFIYFYLFLFFYHY